MSLEDSSVGRPQVPADDLEAEFHRVASLDEVDGTPTYDDMDEYGKHSPDTYRQHHGAWSTAAIHYGNEPNRVGGWVSDEQLETDFHEFASELDRAPGRLEMDEDGPHASSTYCDRIGGMWDDVLLNYGYEPNKLNFAYSLEDVREIMRIVALETERPPEPEDVPEDVRTDILKRWGSWWVAQEMCGVTERALEMAFGDGGDEE